MEERKHEVEFVIDMIDKLCIETDIALIPCETKKGIKYVGILDNTTGKKYALIRK